MNALTAAADGTASDEHVSGETQTSGTGADDTEARARRIGWVPKEEFRGDPDKWRPAGEFLEWGDKLLPVIQERNRKLDDRLARMERDSKTREERLIGELRESREAFQRFRELNEGVAKRSYDRARADILAEREAAVAAADPAAFRKADEALAELDKSAPKPAEARRDGDDDRGGERREESQSRREQPPEVSDAVKNWVAENTWFTADKSAGAKATALFGTNIAMGMSEEDALADVRQSIERLRPDLFENPRREAPASVRTPSGGKPPRRGNGRSFDDLPKEAKDAYTMFHKQDPKFTKEAYLADYAWDNQ